MAGDCHLGQSKFRVPLENKGHFQSSNLLISWFQSPSSRYLEARPESSQTTLPSAHHWTWANARGSSSPGVNLPQWEGSGASLSPRTKSTRLPNTTRGHCGLCHVWDAEPAHSFKGATSTFSLLYPDPYVRWSSVGSAQHYLCSLKEMNSYSWPTRLFWSLTAGRLWMSLEKWLHYLKKVL